MIYKVNMLRYAKLVSTYMQFQISNTRQSHKHTTITVLRMFLTSTVGICTIGLAATVGNGASATSLVRLSFELGGGVPWILWGTGGKREYVVIGGGVTVVDRFYKKYFIMHTQQILKSVVNLAFCFEIPVTRSDIYVNVLTINI